MLTMLELRFPPPHRIDEPHFAHVRQVIAHVLEVQKTRGNRAGNQAIIDGIGLDVEFVRDEGYCAEALDYHLGLLYAHVREGELAAHHFERSRTLPAGGGNLVFSEHQRNSLELRRRQELARERAIPSIVIASMRRSASTSLTQTLAAILDVPIMRVSCGRFLVPRWLNAFMRGGAILHDHFRAIPFNLNVLREGNVREVYVRARDPRSAAASEVYRSDQAFADTDLPGYEHRVVAIYEHAFIPWIVGWIRAAADPSGGLRVHWVVHDPRRSSVSDAARQILSAVAAVHPEVAAHAADTVSEVRANFVTGDNEGWRTRISAAGQKRMWEATPNDVRSLLGLRP
jgi:hypothetical protein